MKILVLILARGGSKRLPNKNILKLGKKHLINWSIDFAKKIPFVCDILVSTDSKKIGSIARKKGVLVPWLRPKRLSLDKTKSHEAALHAINWYENNIQKVDALMLLQPTSPFRRLKTIKEGNDKGSWYGWEVSRESQLDDANLYAVAKGFAESVTKGERKVKYEEDSSTSSGDKVPF